MTLAVGDTSYQLLCRLEAYATTEARGEVRTLTVSLFVLVVLISAVGCAHKPPAPTCDGWRLTPALLFDRHAGSPSAGLMAHRSDWPCAVSFYQFGELLHYRERFIDVQQVGSLGRGWSGYTYRRFDTLREGSAAR
ncbi:MAG: hypothetical protein KAV82_02845 [Phycisphaerae bacterium]|nr:hypothetical protein [Phycisphaerae bacterium]